MNFVIIVWVFINSFLNIDRGSIQLIINLVSFTLLAITLLTFRKTWYRKSVFRIPPIFATCASFVYIAMMIIFLMLGYKEYAGFNARQIREEFVLYEENIAMNETDVFLINVNYLLPASMLEPINSMNRLSKAGHDLKDGTITMEDFKEIIDFEKQDSERVMVNMEHLENYIYVIMSLLIIHKIIIVFGRRSIKSNENKRDAIGGKSSS